MEIEWTYPKKKNTRIYFKFLSFIFNFKKFNFNKLNFCLRVVLQFSCTDMLNATKPLSTTAILATEQLSESLVPSSVPCKRGFPETLTETDSGKLWNLLVLIGHWWQNERLRKLLCSWNKNCCVGTRAYCVQQTWILSTTSSSLTL